MLSVNNSNASVMVRQCISAPIRGMCTRLKCCTFLSICANVYISLSKESFTYFSKTISNYLAYDVCWKALWKNATTEYIWIILKNRRPQTISDSWRPASTKNNNSFFLFKLVSGFSKAKNKCSIFKIYAVFVLP